MAYAVDALQIALSEYINRRLEIPQPKRMRGKNIRLVRLPALAEAKIGLYRTMRATGIRKAELARRVGWQKSQVDRLLDRGMHRDWINSRRRYKRWTSG